MKLEISKCKQADREHLRAKRQYDHTFHKPNKICVASAFEALPLTHKVAIIIHEIGHIIAGYSDDKETNEINANICAYMVFDTEIKYIDSPYGKQLEYITPKKVEEIIPLLASVIDGASMKRFVYSQKDF